jgi:hypothetical protein
VLHYLDGLSYAEIAEALAVPLSTVKGRLFKSRLRLRQTLGDEFRPVVGERETKARRQRRKQGVTAVAPIASQLIRVVVDRVTAPTGEPTVEVVLPHVVLREADGPRELPIVVGKNEALSLALHHQGQTTPRPLSYDLMKALVDGGGLLVTQVAVARLEDTTFYAVITLQQPDGNTLELDARPSDGSTWRCGREPRSSSSSPCFLPPATTKRAMAPVRRPECRRPTKRSRWTASGIVGERARGCEPVVHLPLKQQAMLTKVAEAPCEQASPCGDTIATCPR